VLGRAAALHAFKQAHLQPATRQAMHSCARRKPGQDVPGNSGLPDVGPTDTATDTAISIQGAWLAAAGSGALIQEDRHLGAAGGRASQRPP
jgi:hypothetical protein